MKISFLLVLRVFWGLSQTEAVHSDGIVVFKRRPNEYRACQGETTVGEDVANLE